MKMMRDRVCVVVTVAIVCGAMVLAPTRCAGQGEQGKVERVYGTAQRDDAGAAAAFQQMTTVLHHPRCMNCHTAGDFPRQGDDGHPHTMVVRRGRLGNGVTAQKCSTCHQNHNLEGLHMPPGAPGWEMPPRATPMIWSGLTDRQLCEVIKDPNQNGHRDVDHIVEHMTTPALVLWGWHPGEGRTSISMSQAEFAQKTKEWAAKGAACPAE